MGSLEIIDVKAYSAKKSMEIEGQQTVNKEHLQLEKICM
jgi:hypothetical protein